MIVETELRDEMCRALSGQVSFNEVYSWLMARSHNMHLDSDTAAVELAGEVECFFFERSNGDLSDRELLDEFRRLLDKRDGEA